MLLNFCFPLVNLPFIIEFSAMKSEGLPYKGPSVSLARAGDPSSCGPSAVPGALPSPYTGQQELLHGGVSVNC